MDSETVRLVATAISVVIAGLGGAIVAGLFNRRTAQQTLELTKRAEAEQWTKGKDLEHLQWHRNQKQAAYEKFLLEAESLKSSFIEGSSLLASTYTNLRRHRGHIKVLGSVAVRRAAGAVTSAGEGLRDFVAYGQDRSSTEARTALLHLVDCMDRFVDAVRADLQTSTDEDDELRQTNNERRQQRDELLRDQIRANQAKKGEKISPDSISRSWSGSGSDDDDEE